jgi:hypothetical protein
MSVQHVSFQYVTASETDKKAELAARPETNEQTVTADQRLECASVHYAFGFISRAFPCGFSQPQPVRKPEPTVP